MKKFLQFFLLSALLVSFLLNSGKVLAHDETSGDPDSATQAAQVEYSLAYPGILPDNPLYFLKAARDKLVSVLISDPEKKAEFNLLTSDKRINASYMLAEKGKDELAVTTLSKSNNYLEEAISNLASLKKTEKNINPLVGNLQNAIHKHLDLLAGIKSKVDAKFIKSINTEKQRLENIKKSSNRLMMK